MGAIASKDATGAVLEAGRVPAGMSGGLGNSRVHQSNDDGNEAEPSELLRRLTFVSHAGEDKPFARSLQAAIEAANVATFFDEDMAVGTPAGDEMTTRAATADLGVVVVSRPFFTKEWPMMELNLFLNNGIKIHPLYYGVNPDELQLVLETYDRQAGDDEPAFRRKMKRNPGLWKELMDEISNSTRNEDSTSLPDPTCWREDLGKLGELTGLRREDFGEDEAGYVTAAAKIVSPPVLPTILPQPPGHFVNVPLVDDVVSELLDRVPGIGVRGVVLIGIGGAGKSVIASAVARHKKIRRHFEDGVLWLDAEPGKYSEKMFLLKLNKLARQFEEVVLSRHYRQGRDAQYSLDEFRSVSAAQGFFKMWHTKFNLNCLLVVDNTWNAEVLTAVGAMGFQILVTTRKKTTIPATPGWCWKAVPHMDEESSLLILENCSLAASAVPRESALKVAKTCAFLPLALAITGSTARGVGDPLSSDTWHKLNGKLKDKEDMIRSDSGELGSLHSILAVSMDELGQTRRDRFMMLAVLGNGVLAPTEMLRNLWGEEDPEGARFFIDGLVTRSLLQQRVVDRYSVHDLLLDFAKVNINAKVEKSEAIKEAATSRQTQYLGRLDVLRGYSIDRDSLEGLYSLTGLWQSLVDLSETEDLEVEAYRASLAKLGEEDESAEAALFFSDVGSLYDLQGKYAEAEPLYARCQAMQEKVLGPEHLSVARTLNGRAEALRKQGKYDECESLYERSQAIIEKVRGGEHTDVAGALNNRAGLLFDLRKHAEAEVLLERAIAIWETALGKDHPNVAMAINNLAESFREQGMNEKAIPLYRRAIGIGEKTLGPEHPDVAERLSNLAGSLHSQDKPELYEEADHLYLRATEIEENTLGPNHPRLAITLNNRAYLLKKQEKNEEAGALYERVRAIDEKALDPHHPSLAITLSNQAEVLKIQEEYAEAEALYERALAIRKKAHGESHPEFALGLWNCAQLLECQGKYDKAGSLYERAQEISEQSLGRDHSSVLNILKARAAFLEKQSKYGEAELLHRRLLTIREKRLVPEHQDVAESLRDLAEVLTKQGKYNEADLFLKQLQETFEKHFGRDDPGVAVWLNKRVKLLESQGKYDDADNLFLRELEIDEETLGQNHPDLANRLNLRAGLLYEQGRLKAAISLLDRAYSMLKEEKGESHEDTLNVQTGLEALRKLMPST